MAELPKTLCKCCTKIKPGFKDKNEVQVKVMVKDSQGNSKMQTLTLRNQGVHVPLEQKYPGVRRQRGGAGGGEAEESQALAKAGDNRVVYTGKPGRPKGLGRPKQKPKAPVKKPTSINLPTKVGLIFMNTNM